MSKDKIAFIIVILLSIFTICGFIFEKDDKEHKDKDEEYVCVEYRTITRKRIFSIIPTYETYDECVEWKWESKGDDKE